MKWRIEWPFRLMMLRHKSDAHDVQAIGYVRVSTDRQAEQGVSLEAQEAVENMGFWVAKVLNTSSLGSQPKSFKNHLRDVRQNL
ncbi:MAG: recombinase family protein [Bryobacteraceae bacterium]|nr:recombinase family protein [Bryobacteraceae bacterium]